MVYVVNKYIQLDRIGAHHKKKNMAYFVNKYIQASEEESTAFRRQSNASADAGFKILDQGVFALYPLLCFPKLL
jgi:hypothetical protein